MAEEENLCKGRYGNEVGVKVTLEKAQLTNFSSIIRFINFMSRFLPVKV